MRKEIHSDDLMDKVVLKLPMERLVKLFTGGESEGNCPRLRHSRSKVRTKKMEHAFEE